MDIRRDPNKTLGGAPKPKFTPKLPAGKKPSEGTAAPAPVAPPAPPRKREVDPNFKKNRQARGGDGGRGGRGRGRGGYQGQLQAPAAFFGGLSAGPPSRQASSGGYGISSQLLMSKSEDSKVKKEHSDSDDDGTASVSVAKSKDSRKGDTDDGDMDVVDADDDTMCSEGSEPWPRSYGYTRDAPASVPFGPPKAKTWESLANRPLFAHPQDTVGIEQEEEESTCLIQFPTSVILGSNNPHAKRDAMKEDGDEPVDLTEGNASENNDDSSTASTNASKFTEYLKTQKLSAGKIGKLQVMESGKVFLELTNGLRYEMHAGLNACFSQYVAAVETTDVPAVKTEPGQNSCSSGAQASASMYMLSPITRKITVAPSF